MLNVLSPDRRSSICFTFFLNVYVFVAVTDGARHDFDRLYPGHALTHWFPNVKMLDDLRSHI